MSTPPLVICLGIAVLDHIYEVAEIPPEPVKVRATGHHDRGGGMAATAAVTVAALGGRAQYWGRLGTDAAGDALVADLHRAGVDTSAVRRPDGSLSPSSAVLVDEGGERLIAVFTGRGLADEDTAWLPFDRLAGAGAVLGDCRWPQGALALFQAARRAGVPSVLDADHAPTDDLRPLVAACDFALFSARGLAAYAATEDPREGLARVARDTEALVGVTLGGDGFLWREEEGSFQRLPGVPVTARDTTGAGDTFHGAFALALAEGRPAAEAAAFANAAAALKCRNGAGWSGMPDRPAVDAIAKESSHAAFGR